MTPKFGSTTDDNYDCPQCNRVKAVSRNMQSGIYSCVYIDCRWSNRRHCAYPNCRSWVRMQSDDYCIPHRDLATFIKAVLEVENG